MSHTDLAGLFIDAHPRTDTVLEDVLDGLARDPKTLPPRLFYDREGSRLFDAICALEEYYPTRTEQGIMQDSVAAMAARIGPRATVIEYGSGSSVKTELLLSALIRPDAYVPLDISREHLLASASRVAERHPELDVLPVCADYHQELPELERFARARHSVVYFPGSTIGNFRPSEARAFLTRIERLVGRGGDLLIGVDLKKDRTRLESAYNDAQGVTAAFNLNMLRHVNDRLGPVFDVASFRHLAFWNDTEGRIEMHLLSTRDQEVTVGSRTFAFRAGEPIVTEYSYKYTIAEFTALAEEAGFAVRETWTDSESLFSVHLCEAVAPV